MRRNEDWLRDGGEAEDWNLFEQPEDWNEDYRAGAGAGKRKRQRLVYAALPKHAEPAPLVPTPTASPSPVDLPPVSPPVEVSLPRSAVLTPEAAQAVLDAVFQQGPLGLTSPSPVAVGDPWADVRALEDEEVWAWWPRSA